MPKRPTEEYEIPGLVDSKTDPENKDEWRTDPVLFELCNREFKFNLDAAASAENTLCHNYYTQEDNALEQDWGMLPRITNVWCNPPFSLKWEFLKKGWQEHLKGANCCFLVPGDAQETRWWVETVYDLDYLAGPNLYRPRLHTRILMPRVNFYTPDGLHKKGNNRPSALIIMGWNLAPGIFTWDWKTEAYRQGLIPKGRKNG